MARPWEEPEPGAPYEDPKCDKCGKEMVTSRHWKKASDAERAELTEEGYVVARRDGKCRGCIPVKQEGQPGTLSAEELKARRKQRGRTVKEYIAAREAGMETYKEIAAHIGITVSGLRKAVVIAREAGQEIP